MNSASRLHEVLHAAVQQGANQTRAVDVWADKVLGLTTTDDHLKEDLVVTCLQAMRGELDLVEHALQSSPEPAPPNLYEVQFKVIRLALSPGLLHRQWTQMTSDLMGPDRLLPLRWAAWLLPDEAIEVPDDERADYETLLVKLQEQLESADIPTVTREYLHRQIKCMNAALRLYRIRGAAALQEAAGQAFATATASRQAVERETAHNPEARGMVNRLNALVGYGMGAMRGAKTIRDGTAAMWESAGHLRNLLELIEPGSS